MFTTKIIITSNSHKNYNQIGSVIADKKSDGLEVRLEGSGEVVLVPNGQFKLMKNQA